MRGKLLVAVSALVVALIGPWGAWSSSASIGAASILKSTTISGYQVNGTSLTSLSATIVVPTASCKAAGPAFEIAVALTGQYGTGIISFSSFSEGAVDVECSNHQAHYVTDVAADNTRSTTLLILKPGQVVKITVKGNSRFQSVTLVDESTKKSIHKSVAVALGKFVSSNAQFGSQPLDYQGRLAPAPKFKGLAFKGATVNGKLLGTRHPVAYELTYHGKVSVQPTSLGGKENFRLIFKSN
jgi:hypothetical protein